MRFTPRILQIILYLGIAMPSAILAERIARGHVFGEENKINFEKNVTKNTRLKLTVLEPCFISSSGDENIQNYREITDRTHKNTLEKIQGQIIKNLNFVDLYEASQKIGTCREIRDYRFDSGDEDISDYIFSENFIDFNFVLSINIGLRSDNEMELRVLLWDISKGHFIAGKSYILIIDEKHSNAYKLSNVISDFIFKETAGETMGLFDSRIMYISETGKPGNRKKQVVLMNFDGSRSAVINGSSNIKLTPVFSRYNRDEVYYLEYLKDGPFIVRQNLKNGYLEKISNGQIMTSAAVCNPVKNVDQLILAGTEQEADTNLFLFDFIKNTNKKLTNREGINTSASFSPNGQKIVFVSNRDGGRKLYIMDMTTARETLLSKSEGTYDKPSWSPDGKLIAFVKIAKGEFHIGLMTPEGDDITYLTKGFLIEGIRWSPNSRFIIYTKQASAFGLGSIPKIYIMDVLRKVEVMINTPENVGASDPDWIIN
ncbi:MAG: LpqB family beta-propeller domain-containing protein [Rickettsiales bacterium]|jgi:TolB protein|nr:LpqB family beta-propeller domain-containing protein [Rickettsiales bacterium]